jgi:hypothetical protein
VGPPFSEAKLAVRAGAFSLDQFQGGSAPREFVNKLQAVKGASHA